MRARHYQYYQGLRYNPIYITSTPLVCQIMYLKIHSSNKNHIINVQMGRKLESSCTISTTCIKLTVDPQHT